jgi:hypothetical protein
MSENLEPQLDARVRTALHDLDRRIEQHVRSDATRAAGAPAGTARSGAPARTARGGATRRLIPALAGFAVIAMLITVGWLAGLTESAPPATSTPPATPSPTASSPSRTEPNRPSQSTADALRDGVPADMAQVPLAKRLQQAEPITDAGATRIAATEGIWLISRPDLHLIGADDTGCLKRKKSSSWRACYGYSEILLMTKDLQQIVRAFPIPSLPAQWLVRTPDALYCGRQGDGAIPDSMVCRIDRSTLRFTGRVFPFKDAVDASLPKNFKRWPGAWSNNAPTGTGFDQATLAGGTLKIADHEGKPTITLDPVTLKPVP